MERKSTQSSCSAYTMIKQCRMEFDITNDTPYKTRLNTSTVHTVTTEACCTMCQADNKCIATTLETIVFSSMQQSVLLRTIYQCTIHRQSPPYWLRQVYQPLRASHGPSRKATTYSTCYIHNSWHHNIQKNDVSPKAVWNRSSIAATQALPNKSNTTRSFATNHNSMPPPQQRHTAMYWLQTTIPDTDERAHRSRANMSPKTMLLSLKANDPFSRM